MGSDASGVAGGADGAEPTARSAVEPPAVERAPAGGLGPRPGGHFGGNREKRAPADLAAEVATLPEARRPQAERVGASCLPRYRRLLFQALRGELSPRRALRIMCLHCCGWEMSAARECTAYGCPLWAYNSWNPQARRKRRAKAEGATW